MIGMRNREFAYIAAGTCVLVLALTPGTAQAQYLDPGAGSIILQAVLAIVVGAAAGVKLYWGKISAFLSRRSKRSDMR
jgi:hypothetical protein